MRCPVGEGEDDTPVLIQAMMHWVSTNSGMLLISGYLHSCTDVSTPYIVQWPAVAASSTMH